MLSDSDHARQLLSQGRYTCVLCREDSVHTDTRRGIRPLLELLDAGTDLQGFSAADKVVGKAAAFLYCLMGVEKVYAPVISKSAVEVLKVHGVPVQYDILVPAIFNRDHTGFCPMETAVREISDPQEALAAIRATLAQLKP